MLTKKEIREAQKLINTGQCWLSEGAVGRWCSDLLEEGYCILGAKGHRDYYGNYVPSRFEVKAGTKGSILYRKQRLSQLNTE